MKGVTAGETTAGIATMGVDLGVCASYALGDGLMSGIDVAVVGDFAVVGAVREAEAAGTVTCKVTAEED